MAPGSAAPGGGFASLLQTSAHIGTAPTGSMRPSPRQSKKNLLAKGPIPDYTTLAGGIITMRRKTVDETRFQALGSKNEKNLASG